jgi:hypothetical protein
MEWISVNLLNLVGHCVTIVLFLGGFVTLRRQSRLEKAKAIAIEQYARSAEAIRQCSMLMEQIRILYCEMPIPSSRRNDQHDRKAMDILNEIAKLRSEIFGHSLFLPPLMLSSIDAVYDSFTGLTEAITSRKLVEREHRNKESCEAISNWRVYAREWHLSEWKKMQS